MRELPLPRTTFPMALTCRNATTMQIQLNGQAYELECSPTLTELLDSLGLAGKPVVAEVNCEAILPRNFSTTQIVAGDCVEIITLAAGG